MDTSNLLEKNLPLIDHMDPQNSQTDKVVRFLILFQEKVQQKTVWPERKYDRLSLKPALVCRLVLLGNLETCGQRRSTSVVIKHHQIRQLNSTFTMFLKQIKKKIEEMSEIYQQKCSC